MNDMRERLIELLKKAKSAMKKENLSCDLARNIFVAEYLIANGVTVKESGGCEYCEEYADLPEHFVDGKPVGKIFDTTIQTDENGLWHIEACGVPDIGIKFCPMCGRRLPQPPKEE